MSTYPDDIYADPANCSPDTLANLGPLAPLAGYRNLPRGDLDALAQAIAQVSSLACTGDVRVAEAEINPLAVLPDGRGVCALDGLVVLQ